jgi:hypothetical protein
MRNPDAMIGPIYQPDKPRLAHPACAPKGDASAIFHGSG